MIDTFGSIRPLRSNPFEQDDYEIFTGFGLSKRLDYDAELY